MHTEVTFEREELPVRLLARFANERLALRARDGKSFRDDGLRFLHRGHRFVP
jgi:hypothetical protein